MFILKMGIQGCVPDDLLLLTEVVSIPSIPTVGIGPASVRYA